MPDVDKALGDKPSDWVPVGELSERYIPLGTLVTVVLDGWTLYSGTVEGMGVNPEGTRYYDVRTDQRRYHGVHEAHVQRIDFADRESVERWLDA